MAYHKLSTDSEHRLARAKRSLEGLSVGDALGEQFCHDVSVQLIARCQTPPGPWSCTDETVMASCIVEMLEDNESIDQELLADYFAAHYLKDPYRGYGSSMQLLLRNIAGGAYWRTASHDVFGADGTDGNGAAARAAPVGAYYADDIDALIHNARLSAEITHNNHEAVAAAIAVAAAAGFACSAAGLLTPESGNHMLQVTYEHTPESETRHGIARALEISRHETVINAVRELGNGARLTAMDTAPFALWCAAKHMGNFRKAIWETIEGLGDLDANCAIVGGVVACSILPQDFPQDWRAKREPLPRWKTFDMIE
ncbi:ADP-ribosylglycohydrolase family protein [Candidatus Sumerlaeota bacterium]|nr:ADP-ribosylglycohydrolase family protein [Candidatus Sumerlaeota bacterium]